MSVADEVKKIIDNNIPNDETKSLSEAASKFGITCKKYNLMPIEKRYRNDIQFNTPSK